jgi:endonuclease YncB( thermonuclease family)
MADRSPGGTVGGAMPTSIRFPSLLLGVLLGLAACGGVQPATPEPAGTKAPAASQAPAAAPEGVTERATVVRVVDGDTIIIDRGHGEERLRYIGIDAPESVKPGSPVEFMGQEASAANARLVEGRELILEPDVSDMDRYGRLLRYAWVEDPDRPGSLLMVNLALVASGYAQAVSYPPDVRYQDDLRAAERAAREQDLGLWGEPTPAP